LARCQVRACWLCASLPICPRSIWADHGKISDTKTRLLGSRAPLFCWGLGKTLCLANRGFLQPAGERREMVFKKLFQKTYFCPARNAAGILRESLMAV
jgi:hypothetical protein